MNEQSKQMCCKLKISSMNNISLFVLLDDIICFSISCIMSMLLLCFELLTLFLVYCNNIYATTEKCCEYNLFFSVTFK